MNLGTHVRPIVTLALVAAYIIYAYVNTESAMLIKDMVLVVIGFWFGSRTSTNSQQPTSNDSIGIK